MRRRFLVPVAGLIALAALAGCGPAAPTPTPSASETATAAPTPEPTTTPAADPTTVGALPGTALLRVSVTAAAEGREARLVLTFARAATGASAADELEALQEECPNAWESQLADHPGLEPTGAITSQLEVTGFWPEGMTVGIAAGGQLVSFGEGRDVAPVADDPGMYGCAVSVVTGPGNASFTSLLLGDPATPDRTDLENALAAGLFGFEVDAGSAVEVNWRDCVIQLSASAQRLATERGWTLPAEWGEGCLIGDSGTV